MSELKCVACEAPLTGGLDTYGDLGYEMCFVCWTRFDDVPENRSWYGMAPHHHDLTLTGDYIGSTVYDPLPEPDANGVYFVNGRYFIPDAETDGAMGVWYTSYPAVRS